MIIMAIKNSRATTRTLRSLEKNFLALRAKAGRLRGREIALLRRFEKLARRGRKNHLTTIEHRPGRKDKITQHRAPGSRSLVALARAQGGSGLFCGCRPIRIFPQPNGDIDFCILIGCSNDPFAGFHCEYWCSTLVASTVVGIAKSRRRRRNPKN
jgi:hypothetical protein